MRNGFALVVSVVVFVGLTVSLAVGVSPQPPSAQLSFCLEASSNEHKVRTFWQDIGSGSDCALDPNRLIELHRKLEGDTSNCDRLLLHQVRRALLDTSVAIFEDALIGGNFINSTQQLARAIFRLDPRLSRDLFERLIDAVYYVVEDVAQLATLLAANPLLEQRPDSLLTLWARYNARLYAHPRMAPLMAGFLSHMGRNLDNIGVELRLRWKRAVATLPESLRLLYLEPTVRLLNTHHWEYLYAPRDNGPDAVRRLPLTWIAEKNTTDGDGVFEVHVLDSSGEVAIGSRYDGKLGFLQMDETRGKPFFFLTDDEGATTRWWQVRWHEDHFVLTNAKTKQMLCASGEYDENRRYVTVEEQLMENHKMERCHWVATV